MIFNRAQVYAAIAWAEVKIISPVVKMASGLLQANQQR